MTSQTKKFLHHPRVALIDSHVERWLAPFVSRVHVTSGSDQLFHDSRLVSKRRVVDCTVAIFVLKIIRNFNVSYMYVEKKTKQLARNLKYKQEWYT